MYDVAIIGAGPVGIFSVFACGMQGFRCILIDSKDRIGGQCAFLYPNKNIYDVPGFACVTASQLVQNLTQQMMQFEPEILLNAEVVDSNLETDGKFMLTADQKTISGSIAKSIQTRSIIIATGGGLMKPIKLQLAGADLFENKNIFYNPSISQFAGKTIAVLGGGDAALDYALEIAQVAVKVYLIHRRDSFRCHQASWQKFVQAEQVGKTELFVPCVVESLQIDSDKLIGLNIVKQNESRTLLFVDAVVPCFGLEMQHGNLFDVEINERGIMVAPDTMRTSKPGIYSIGDGATYLGKRKLIAVGFAEAFICAYDIFAKLNPDKLPNSGHSTDSLLFAK